MTRSRRDLTLMATAAALALALTGGGCALRYQTAPLDRARALPGGDAYPVIELDGAEIRYDVQGPRGGDPDRAETVVLIHGFGSSLGSWEALVPALATRYQVVRLDLKGFGLSSKYEGDYGIDAQAALVLALLDALGVERTHVVAHSYGCAVALQVARRAPTRVGRMVLTSAWVYEEQLPWSLRAARTPGMGELIFGAWYAENLEWRFGLSFHAPETIVTQEVLDRSRALLELPGAKATALATVRALDLARLQTRYDEVDAPTLLLYGREDRVARPAFGERLAAQLTDARLELYGQCGHFPMLEHAVEYNTRVRDWLAGGGEAGR